MDPASLAGLAIGVASIAVQIYSGCIQGIQLVITAIDYPEDCKYLNLRLRMEQQRLLAWSETSGLLALATTKDASKIYSSNTFASVHRTTVLDLLLQIQTLFDEFASYQRRYGGLRAAPDADGMLAEPDRDARAANFPLPERRRDFIRQAVAGLREKSKDGMTRLRWVSFDKEAFERLLGRFAALNDGMTNLLDMQLQVEIRDSVQDTNRGVLQLHHRIADISKLVMALSLKLDDITATAGSSVHSVAPPQPPPPPPPPPPYSVSPLWPASPVAAPAAEYLSFSSTSRAQREDNAFALEQLAKLARFKAFNASIDGGGGSGGTGVSWDDATARFLDLERPGRAQDLLQLKREDIEITGEEGGEAEEAQRCGAWLKTKDGQRMRVWVEWKDYDVDRPPGGGSPSKQVIVDRVRKLAALLNHTPKPEAFRTPHCLGWFDKAPSATYPPPPAHHAFSDDDDDDDVLNHRLGLVFTRPSEKDHLLTSSPSLSPSLPPFSLHDLLASDLRPSLTQRVALAHAVATCLLYLHAVNWLHKGLRSHNVVFFPDPDGRIDYAAPYLSGFDFSRPARPDEETDMPGDDAEYNLYRHPHAQTSPFTLSSDRHASSSVAAASQPPPRERFKKSFDIYALGVFLIELAHWQPVDRVLGLDMRRARGRASVALGVRERLLAPESIAGLQGAMGETYADAARRCVAGGEELGLEPGDDETDGAVAVPLGRRFYERVVKKLGEIRT